MGNVNVKLDMVNLMGIFSVKNVIYIDKIVYKNAPSIQD